MREENRFYRLTVGSPGSGKSEISQGQYANLVLPAATNDYVDAIVTYVESWTTIHVQLLSADRILSHMEKQLQQQYLMSKPLMNPTLASAGILKYATQKGFYRVIIIKRVDPMLVLIRFVDFGYTDIVTKQLIHPISQRLINVPAQAFPIQMKLQQSIAGSMSLSAFRKYMKNAQVIIQLGGQIVDNSFVGTVHVTDNNDQSHNINEVVKSKLPIKRSVTSPEDDASEAQPFENDQLPARQINTPNGEMEGYEGAPAYDNQINRKQKNKEMNAVGDPDNLNFNDRYDQYGDEDNQINRKQKNAVLDSSEQFYPETNYPTDVGGENGNVNSNDDDDGDDDDDDDNDDDEDALTGVNPGEKTTPIIDDEYEITKDLVSYNDDQNLKAGPQTQYNEYGRPNDFSGFFIDERQQSNLLRKRKLKHKRPFEQKNDVKLKANQLPIKFIELTDSSKPLYSTTFESLIEFPEQHPLREARNGNTSANNSSLLSNVPVWMIFVSVVIFMLVIVCIIFAVVFTCRWRRSYPSSERIYSSKKKKKRFSWFDRSGSDTLEDSITGVSISGDSGRFDATKPSISRTAADNLAAEDLSSVIGVMAYGGLRDDIETNIRRKRQKQKRRHAGRSVVTFNIPSKFIEKNKRIGKIPETVTEDEDESDTASNGYTDQESSATSASVSTEGTENDQHSSSFTSSSIDSTDDDEVGSEEEFRSESGLCKSKEVAINMNEVDVKSPSETFSPSSNTIEHDESEIAVKGGSLKKVAEQSEDRSNEEMIVSSPQVLPHNWTRGDATVSSRESTTDSYESTQRNSPLQHTELQQSSVKQTFSFQREPSSSQPTFVVSNEEIKQNSYSCADSIHSSDFEIPSYLNTVPAPSYSHQSIHQISKAWIRSQQSESTRPTSKDRARPQSETERTNSTQPLTQTYTDGRMHSGAAKSTWILSTSQIENTSRQLSQNTKTCTLRPKTALQVTEKTQIYPHSRKDTRILPTTQLKDQTPSILETRRYAANSQSFPSRRHTKGSPQFNGTPQSPQRFVTHYPESDTTLVASPLSKAGSESIRSREIGDCLSSKTQKAPEVEVKAKATPVEEALKMKMNITLLPKRSTPTTELTKYTGTENRETSPSRSTSFESTTTYESTRDLSTTTS